MIGIAGQRTSIARAFMGLMSSERFVCDRLAELPLDLDAYLICSGFLAGRRLRDIDEWQANRTWQANFVEPARFCDRVFAANERARICIIGSHSGFAGSYDMAYAGAKAALHLYVETKQLEHPSQMLVAIAPTIIADSGMTERRTDQEELKARAAATRLGRWLQAREVAIAARHALCEATPFLSNTIIRMPGR